MPYIQPLSFAQSNPLLTGVQMGNQLINQGLQNQGQINNNQITAAQAQYAPYNQYADAVLKSAQAQYMPLQYMAAPLSNPLFMAALSSNPNQLQNYMSRFANASSALPGQGLNIPIPGQTQQNQGLFSKISSLMNRNNQSQQNQNTQNNNSGMVNVPGLNGAVASPQMAQQVGNQINNLQPGQSYTIPDPALNDNSSPGPQIPNVMSGAIRRTLAPYYANPETGKGSGLGAGTTYVDPKTGQQISSLTSKQTTQAQQAASAIGRINPLLDRISQEASPFQTYAGKAKLIEQQLSNPAQSNPSGNLPSQYAQLESDLNTVPESYVKAFGINVTDQTLKTMRESIEPKLGESGAQYKQRILSTLSNLNNEELGQAQQQLKTGINLNQVPGQPYAGPAINSLPQNNQAQQVSQQPVQPPQQQQGNLPPQQSPVLMVHPDGRRGYVPASQVRYASAMGYRRI